MASTNTIPEKEKENKTTPLNNSNSSDVDLKKAIAFLLSKEMKEYSLDKKREFLLNKMPPEIVEKAISIFPMIQSNINTEIQDYIKVNRIPENENNWLSKLGILSTVLLTTLGVNYLLDLNRNKKNDLFYKECEKKINEELKKLSKDVKNEISNELNEYVSKESLKEKVNNQIVEYTHQRGLNLNLSAKSVKDEIVKIKESLDNKDKLIKDLNVKVENNKIILKSEIVKETSALIEENNNKLLIKIIENQDRLLNMVTNAMKKSEFKEPGNFSLNDNKNEYMKIINNSEINSDGQITNQKQELNSHNNIYSQKEESNICLENKQIEENKNLVENNSLTQNNFSTKENNLIENKINDKNELSEDHLNLIKSLLEQALNSIKEEKDKLPFIKQLQNQFSAILETLKKAKQANEESEVENKKSDQDIYASLPFINITNRVYKNVNSDVLSNLLKTSFFKNESGSVYKYYGNVEKLSPIVELFN